MMIKFILFYLQFQFTNCFVSYTLNAVSLNSICVFFPSLGTDFTGFFDLDSPALNLWFDIGSIQLNTLAHSSLGFTGLSLFLLALHSVCCLKWYLGVALPPLPPVLTVLMQCIANICRLPIPTIRGP